MKANHKWLTPILIAQAVVSFYFSKTTPDYYVRSATSVLKWAYTGGVWLLVFNVACSCLIWFLWQKATPKKFPILLGLSVILTIIWLVYPYFYSMVGDALYWRFP